jgi:YidC/Oxa1 family membrane protein insertase
MSVLANVLQPLIDVAHAILRFFHDSVGLGWGMSIIGLTVVVRLFILPLTYKSLQGMRDVQRLKPDMDRIRERYAGDRQKMNEEMMALYQRHKVNPASCVPT